MASTATTTAPTPAGSSGISLDVTKDLESVSALKTMLSSQEGAIFNVLGELTKYGAIGQAASAEASAKITLSGTAKASWKTGNGIEFSLKPQASCSVSAANKSAAFAVAMKIDSSETTDIVEGPSANIVYLNIEIDFDIQGSLSGSGAVSGVGVAGKASGSKNATLSFCQPVDVTLPPLMRLRRLFLSWYFHWIQAALGLCSPAVSRKSVSTARSTANWMLLMA